MKSTEEDKRFAEQPVIKVEHYDVSSSGKENNKGHDKDGNGNTGEIDVNPEIENANDIKIEPNINQMNVLSSEHYDPDIAVICLGTLGDDTEKTSANDSSLSEMTNSVESVTNGAQENNNNSDNDKGGINGLGTVIKQEANEIVDSESKKRPLSPNRDDSNEAEIKRFKFEDCGEGNNDVISSNQVNSSIADFVDTTWDNCLPIAVVAPLGFSDDLFINPTNVKDDKDEIGDVKQDIAALLDSFGDDDDKTLTLFDAEFDKIKSDIMSSNSFKTMDGNQWTFDTPHEFDNLFKSESTKSDTNAKNNQNNEVKKSFDGREQKMPFQRQPSVEHDILDFEKVLNNVMKKRSQNVKPMMHNQECVPPKLPCTLPRNTAANTQCNQTPNQPCQHVANSDLLRELLDQKTETTSAQAKRRQEIDLSFLQPDVLAGKGLTVSSDKILQTRTIDPRSTSIPYNGRGRSSAQISSVSSSVISSQATTNVYTSTQSSSASSVVSSAVTTTSDRDPISLAEQRRAIITLHHKVPPYDVSESSVTSSMQSPNEHGTSNIIKEAFDFASEIADDFDTARSNSKSPRVSLMPGVDINRFSPRTMYSNEQRVQPQSDFMPDGFRQNTSGPMSNRQMIGNRQSSDQNGLLMKYDDTNAMNNFDHTRAMRPNSVDQSTGIPMSHMGYPSMSSYGKSQGFPNGANNGANGGYSPDGNMPNMRGLQRSNSMPGHMDHQFRMDTMQSQNIMGEQSNMKFNMPNSMSNMSSADRATLANLMMQRNQNKFQVNSSMGYPNTGMNQSGHTMSQQGQPMRGQMTSPDLLQIATDDPLQGRLSDPTSASRGPMGMMRPDMSLQIGRQEQIRAMNVQQWYRRRMQTQMNRFPGQQQQQMMPRPGMGPGVYPGQDSIRPQTHAAAMNKPRQGANSANIGMQRFNFPSGLMQGQNQFQNTMGQGQNQGQMSGQLSYQQYVDQRSQRINDMQMQHQMRRFQSYNATSPTDSGDGAGMVQPSFPDPTPEFDIKPQSQHQTGSEMFPFNI